MMESRQRSNLTFLNLIICLSVKRKLLAISHTLGMHTRRAFIALSPQVTLHNYASSCFSVMIMNAIPRARDII